MRVTTSTLLKIKTVFLVLVKLQRVLESHRKENPAQLFALDGSVSNCDLDISQQLAGQRSRTDVLALRWSWVNLDRMRYEVPDPKNKSAHIVSLRRQAEQELEALRKEALISDCDFVFSKTGTSLSSGVTKAKRRLDALINSDRKLRRVEDMEHWALHDFRRSQATSRVEAGCDEGVVDRTQNHTATGSRPSTVSAVYNKAHKLDARSKAVKASGTSVWLSSLTRSVVGSFFDLPILIRSGNAGLDIT